MSDNNQPITYRVTDRKAYLTLNRPERLNALTREVPGLLATLVERANDDPDVRVIIVQGAGKSFCSGYDLKAYAEGDAPTDDAPTGDTPSPAWDAIADYRKMRQRTDEIFSLWRSLKPTIAKVQGYAIAGGSDIAMSADLLVMADDARIGYPPTRLWGCPTTAMWVYRLGAQMAKRMLLTGDTITGAEAAECGLALQSVPVADLDAAVESLADRMSGVPTNHLVMQKMLVNQAYDNMGLGNTQTIATLFDGITRSSAEGDWFKRFAERDGFHAAVAWRDSGAVIPNGGGDLPSPEAVKEIMINRGWADK